VAEENKSGDCIKLSYKILGQMPKWVLKNKKMLCCFNNSSWLRAIFAMA